ncbi:MAG: LysE family transporter, partial [Sulfolobales archaeon]
MTSIIYSFFIGIVLGLSLAAPPGPINAIMAYESTRSKYNGIAVGAGAMSADVIFFIITYLFYQIIPPKITIYFYFIGGVIMIYLAYLVVKSKPIKRDIKGNYLVGLMTGLTNPFQIIWWLTAGLSMINQLTIYVIPGF